MGSTFQDGIALCLFFNAETLRYRLSLLFAGVGEGILLRLLKSRLKGLAGLDFESCLFLFISGFSFDDFIWRVRFHILSHNSRSRPRTYLFSKWTSEKTFKIILFLLQLRKWAEGHYFADAALILLKFRFGWTFCSYDYFFKNRWLHIIVVWATKNLTYLVQS